MIDTLSEVLRAVHMTGAAYFDVHARAPWVAETPGARVVAPRLMPGLDHVIEFHVLVEGRCVAGLIGEAPIELVAGDAIMLPRGDAHVLSSAPGMRGEPAAAVRLPPAGEQLPVVINYGRAGVETAHLICGFIACDARPFNPLLDTLPPLLCVRGDGDRRLAQLVELSLAESRAGAPGAAHALGRLGELLFLEVMRRYIAELPAEHSGWLAGLRDPHVGRALARLHDQPGQAWKLEALARAAGLSRTAFAERFRRFVGMPPLRYLTLWRLQLAANLLGRGDGVAAVAAAVGYASESAFSRAFKRHAKLAPASWRDARVGAALQPS